MELFIRVSWTRAESEENRAEGKDQRMKGKIMAAVGLRVWVVVGGKKAGNCFRGY